MAKHQQELLRAILEKTLESAKEVQLQHQGQEALSTGEFLLQVAETLADKASAAPSEIPAEKGWQELLERGLKSKIALLSSNAFKSTSEASDLLGIGEPGVRKRIRERKLFA